MIYVIFPALIMLTGIGILKEEQGWCTVAEVCMVLSSVVTLLTFAGGIGLFLCRRWNDAVIYTKVTLSFYPDQSNYNLSSGRHHLPVTLPAYHSSHPNPHFLVRVTHS